MASMGELKAVHMPSEQLREFRSLVKYRKTLDHRIGSAQRTFAKFTNQGNGAIALRRWLVNARQMTVSDQYQQRSEHGTNREVKSCSQSRTADNGSVYDLSSADCDGGFFKA